MVPAGNSVEHVACTVDIAAFAVHVDEGVGDGEGRSVAEFEEVGVDLFAKREVVEGGDGFEKRREGEVVGGCDGGGGEGVDVGGDGFVEGGGMGLGAEEVDP